MTSQEKSKQSKEKDKKSNAIVKMSKEEKEKKKPSEYSEEFTKETQKAVAEVDGSNEQISSKQDQVQNYYVSTVRNLFELAPNLDLAPTSNKRPPKKHLKKS